MKSLVLTSRDVVELAEVPIPEVTDPNAIRVRVTATSICGSDIHLAAGHLTDELGFALGHEWVGVVDAVGSDVRSFAVGDRVTGPAAPWCGNCEMCSSGQPQRCLRGGVHGSGEFMGNLGGTQSEFLIVPWADNCVIQVPETVSDEAALTIGDVLSTGWTGVRHVLRPHLDTIVVIGCGPVGLSAVMAAKAEGVTTIITVDRVQKRLDLAGELGATHTFVSGEDTAQAILAEFAHGVPAVVDAAGVQGSFDLAQAVLGVGSSWAILGIPGTPITLDMTGLLMRNVSLWTGLGDLTQLAKIRDQITSGVIDPTPMFTHRISLDEAPAMYKRMAAGDTSVIKVLVHI